ncbi:hypothetical protein PTNB29_05002 [Pyrenophora teres f. teres]|nr:hypothetical protein PTNB29_05002 [Pyrenophora teres f. teres]
MATGAALTPDIVLSWPTPNYVDPVSQKVSIEAAVYAITITMICFVAARLYVRGNQKSGIATDDWIMISNTATSVCLLILTTKGLGRHLYDVKIEWLVPFAKLNLASLTLYTVSITLTKISVWVGSRITIALCIEYNVGTMSGCLPCLRPLLKMVAPNFFAGSSAARPNGYPTSSGRGSWRKSHFGSKNANSVQLGSTGPSEYDDTHELTDAKNLGVPRIRIADGKRASQVGNNTVPLPDIQVTKDMYIRDGNDSPHIMINDTTSEEWIMKDDSHR